MMFLVLGRPSQMPHILSRTSHAVLAERKQRSTSTLYVLNQTLTCYATRFLRANLSIILVGHQDFGRPFGYGAPNKPYTSWSQHLDPYTYTNVVGPSF